MVDSFWRLNALLRCFNTFLYIVMLAYNKNMAGKKRRTSSQSLKRLIDISNFCTLNFVVVICFSFEKQSVF